MMNDILRLVLMWGAGMILGGMFFGGLWWTIRKGVSSPYMAVWFIGSLLLRTSLTVAGFYFIAGGHWERLLVCLVGFVMARQVVSHFILPADSSTRIAPETRHASQS